MNRPRRTAVKSERARRAVPRRYLIAKGRRDALAWATRMELLPAAAAAAEQGQVARKPVPELVSQR